MRGKGATLATGANQVGSAPSTGAAAVTRRAIPGAPDPATAHGFCFGFGADGEGLAERLKHLFGGEDGYGNGTITEGGCNTPNFSEAGVIKGKGLWQEDDKGYLIQGVHNGNATEGHPRCSIGGTVPVEKVKTDRGDYASGRFLTLPPGKSCPELRTTSASTAPDRSAAPTRGRGTACPPCKCCVVRIEDDAVCPLSFRQ